MKNISYRLFFHAVNNEGRLSIIELLRKSPKTVLEISKEIEMEQSLVSKNLKCLTDCGFVDVKKEGNFRLYSLDKETIVPILKSIDKHIEKFEGRLKTCGIVNPKKELAYSKSKL